MSGRWARLLSPLAAWMMVLGSAAADELQRPSAGLYGELVERLQGGDLNIDYGLFRLSYVETRAYDGYDTDWRTRREAILELAGRDDMEGASALLQEFHATNFAFFASHAMAAALYERRGRQADAQRHLRIAKGLYDSIMNSGQGNGPDSPYLVIFILEEYEVLRILDSDLMALDQRLEQLGSEFYDVWRVKSKLNGQESEIWFDIGIPWTRSPVMRELREQFLKRKPV